MRRIVVDTVTGLAVFNIIRPESSVSLASPHPRPSDTAGNLIFLEDGSKVFVGSDSGIVQLYNVTDGRRLEELVVGDHDSLVRALAVGFMSYFENIHSQLTPYLDCYWRWECIACCFHC